MAKKKVSIPEQRRQAAKAAMPEVKKLVRRYGRTAIANCLGKLREYEKNAARLNALKKEVKQLERQLN